MRLSRVTHIHTASPRLPDTHTKVQDVASAKVNVMHGARPSSTQTDYTRFGKGKCKRLAESAGQEVSVVVARLLGDQEVLQRVSGLDAAVVQHGICVHFDSGGLVEWHRAHN